MTAQTKPLRIKRLTLTDFRAFPGPAPAHFDLDGKNLLIYGENGSGKSSIFHALKEFFSLKPAKPLAHYRNVFSAQTEEVCKVVVEYVGDATVVEWTADKHPCDLDLSKPVTNWYEYYYANSDSRTISVAMRSAVLNSKFSDKLRHSPPPLKKGVRGDLVAAMTSGTAKSPSIPLFQRGKTNNPAANTMGSFQNENCCHALCLPGLQVVARYQIY